MQNGQIVTYEYNLILYGNENEQAIAACNNMDNFHQLTKQKIQEEKECKRLILFIIFKNRQN